MLIKLFDKKIKQSAFVHRTSDNHNYHVINRFVPEFDLFTASRLIYRLPFNECEL